MTNTTRAFRYESKNRHIILRILNASASNKSIVVVVVKHSYSYFHNTVRFIRSECHFGVRAKKEKKKPSVVTREYAVM